MTPATKVNLGQVLLQQRKFDEAVELFRAASAAEPFNATAAYNLATALTRAGNTDAGQQAMRRFQTLRDSAYAVTYAQGYLQQGRYAEAMASTGAEPDLVDRSTPAVTLRRRLVADVHRGTGGGVRPAPACSSSTSTTTATWICRPPAPAGSISIETTAAGFPTLRAAAHLTAPEGVQSVAAVAGDYDNDGRPDLFVLRATGGVLMHQRADGTFEDVTANAGLATQSLRSRAAAWVDVDHDGDLDLVVGSPLHLWRNNGDGKFTDITTDAGLANTVAGIAIVPTDFDNRRDVDLLILPEGSQPILYRNMRDGTFRDVAAASRLPQDKDYTAVAAADVNKDGYTDFFFARAGASGVFAISDGKERFVTREGPPGSAGATARAIRGLRQRRPSRPAVLTKQGPRLYRNVGTDWIEETAHAKLDALGGDVATLVAGRHRR